jgi:hypothetical protein
MTDNPAGKFPNGEGDVRIVDAQSLPVRRGESRRGRVCPWGATPELLDLEDNGRFEEPLTESNNENSTSCSVSGLLIARHFA